jgi:hypothetical protein
LLQHKLHENSHEQAAYQNEITPLMKPNRMTGHLETDYHKIGRPREEIDDFGTRSGKILAIHKVLTKPYLAVSKYHLCYRLCAAAGIPVLKLHINNFD